MAEKQPIYEKHPPLTEEQIKERKEAKEKAKEQYTVNVAEIEKTLTEFLEVKDPLLWEEKVIAWIRRPTMKELSELIPTQVQKYLDNPEGLPVDKISEYDELFYTNMEKMIVIPKKTAKEWKETANPWFLRLFFEHIISIAKVLEMQVEGF